MLVGINTLFFVPDHNYGAGTYLLELIEGLGRVSDLDYVIFTNKKNHEVIQEISKFPVVRTGVDGSNRITRILYEQCVLHPKAKRMGCDILFCPGYLGPVFPVLPTVLTVHDTQYLDVQEHIPRSTRMTYGLILPRAIKRAKKVIAISEFTRSRLAHHFAIGSDRMSVVLEGAPTLEPLETPDVLAATLTKLNLKKPFLLTVSSATPHKNMQRLKEAFRLARASSSEDFELVIVGHTSTEHAEGVRYTGYVSEEEKHALYLSASAYVTASLYEGFGLTLLEAMQAGTPVISSNAGSLPEVGGNACLYFDPLDTEAIKKSILSVMFDEKRRNQLIAAAEVQLKRFTWEKCAKETENVFRSIF